MITNIAVGLVESATVLAGQTRAPLCYVCDKPRALVEYAIGSQTQIDSETLTGASIQKFYQQCRANGSPAFVGD